ncbi:hypothetical protein ACA29_12210 [Lederbergia galactosidilytica]|uniref:Uncharacterized protein n=1 Tax=Lederbergia galactosidilytica TaxID=217031 RepID=A0A0Q9Y914_9BACI|nr:hypothetical protein ACA29_12210 [Lederbergia galactosidilytica]
MDGKISTTINRISDMDDVLSGHSTTLEQHAKAIKAKAEATIVDDIRPKPPLSMILIKLLRITALLKFPYKPKR